MSKSSSSSQANQSQTSNVTDNRVASDSGIAAGSGATVNVTQTTTDLGAISGAVDLGTGALKVASSITDLGLTAAGNVASDALAVANNAAKANLRAALPSAEAYYADNGTYAGMDAAALAAVGCRASATTASVAAGTRTHAATRVWFATTGRQTTAKAHPPAAASADGPSAPSARRAAQASSIPSQKQARIARRCA